MKEEKRKFALYLGAATATRQTILSASFLTKIEEGEAEKLAPHNAGDADYDAYFMVSKAKTPRWMQILSGVFNMPQFKKGSPASVVIFEEAGRIFAVTFGYGSKLLNEYQVEGDFGIKVAINAVADTALKAVQKSNVASAIQQFAQSSFKARFGSFGGQNKFEILKRVSGAVAADDDLNSVVGAAGLSLTTKLNFADIKQIASKALTFYASDAYKKTAFSVVDEFKPVFALAEVGRLDALLLQSVQSQQSTFEICLPQLNVEDSGYVKIYGSGLKGDFPDVSLDLYKTSFDNLADITLADLKDDSVCLYNDEHVNVGNWSVYKCLIGGLDDADGTRYVLNDAHWYIPSEAIVQLVEKYFDDRKAPSDPKLATFEVTEWEKEVGKKGKTKAVPVYEREETYNERVANDAGYVLFDQIWHVADDGTFQKLEVCDLYDPESLRMIHVKRTSRQPSMLSYLFEQGQRAADLWQRDDVRAQFIARVRAEAGDAAADKLAAVALEPGALIIEFAIADHENAQGHHTIPFLGKLSFENKARDVELRGFKSQVRFITLEKPHAI
ncbi:TIGR04141 family sporadically distributed protein [Mesorhizobium sp. M1216]|uniref:TIGR04141 family sporadically distributed protein n=1 Tax=Mesorhizobium sp. M1216 TaxID=2957069 RepID=UPI00333917A4